MIVEESVATRRDGRKWTWRVKQAALREAMPLPRLKNQKEPLMQNDPLRSKTSRAVTAGIGLLFTGLATAIVLVSDRSAGPLAVAAVIGLLGLDAVVSAMRNKGCILSRIGPLP